MASRSYPADPADAALRIFLDWFGRHYARSTKVAESESTGAVVRGTVSVGRKWELGFALVNTLQPETTFPFEAARAAVEQRLDLGGHSIALWMPRGARLPESEPGLSEIALAVEQAGALEDGRLEVRRPVHLYLRRTSTSGSVITIMGGLAAHWAQFTNRVPGSYQLNANELYRLPASHEECDALTEHIVLAAAQPDIDESQVIAAEDAWTANRLDEGGSCVLGTPQPETDEQSAVLRRNLRKLLREAEPVARGDAPTKALVLLGAATYAEEEKLSWAIRGMDPALYAGYDIIAVVADGLVKALLEPPRNTLPWDVPLD